VAEVHPHRVYHLAGQASVAAAWASPADTLTDNVVMTLRVLEAVRLGAPDARVLVIGSAEEYGDVHEDQMPVREEQALRPLDPYGVSKVGADLLALQYYLAYGLQVVRVRPFNHIGPRQRRGFVLADFAAQIAGIERGEGAPVLQVGNLQASRDFTDVRDIVRAYQLALEHGEAGAVYNVCSGKAVCIADLLATLLEAATVKVQVEVDPARQRPVDRPTMLGSFAALYAVCGWQPEIPIAQSVLDTLAYWRNVQQQ
jgi:GDP-4-dehydro-6-deoxy-D-mannose reductase